MKTTLKVVGTIAEAAAGNFAPEHADQLAKAMNMLSNAAESFDEENREADDSDTESDAAESSITEKGVVSTTVQAPGELALEVALLRRTTGGGSRAIDDGDVLEDGRGNPEDGDRFRIFVSPSSQAYVYVVSADATGWIQAIFPQDLPSDTEPVAMGTQIVLPPAGDWYRLDQARGVETFYFIASRRRLADLEAVLTPFVGQERPPAKGFAYEAVTKPTILTRGIADTKTADQSIGAGDDATPRSFLAAAGESAIIVTRWFHHQ
jgi:hypothetical protein